MKYGMKIPAEIFCVNIEGSANRICDAFGGKHNLLSFLNDEVDYVELGVITCNWNAKDVKNAVAECIKYGLSVTIHGTLNGATSPEEFFSPYTELFLSGFQEKYNITVHPFQSYEKTVDFLKEICCFADEKAYPVQITLENQRFSDDSKKENLCRHVADMVEAVGSSILYNCFDFGHHLFNVKKYGEDFDRAENKFLTQVKHTHIHSLYEGGTHFPLSCGEVMLEKNLTELILCGYDGVFLLELDVNKWDNIKENIVASIGILKAAVCQVQRKLEASFEYKENFSDNIHYVAKRIEKADCGLGIMGPAMYIAKFGDTKLAIDPSFWELPIKDVDKKDVLAVISECDGVIVTHNHSDHYDAELLDEIPMQIPIFVPDFIDYKRENVINTTDGFSMNIKGVCVEFFESAHSLGTNIVPEYGFSVNYNGKNYVFPADVRDYEKPHPDFFDVEVLVAHLWLGKENALNLYDNPYMDLFCNFVNGFGTKRVLLGHILDFRRTVKDMWSEIHYKAIKGKIPESRILKLGDFVEF